MVSRGGWDTRWWCEWCHVIVVAESSFASVPEDMFIVLPFLRFGSSMLNCSSALVAACWNRNFNGCIRICWHWSVFGSSPFNHTCPLIFAYINSYLWNSIYQSNNQQYTILGGFIFHHLHQPDNVATTAEQTSRPDEGRTNGSDIACPDLSNFTQYGDGMMVEGPAKI